MYIDGRKVKFFKIINNELHFFYTNKKHKVGKKENEYINIPEVLKQINDESHKQHLNSEERDNQKQSLQQPLQQTLSFTYE